MKWKRKKLSERQQMYLLMIFDHGLTGSFSEFAKPETRRTVHSLAKKKLVQWIDYRWILTVEGDREARLLVLDRAKMQNN